MTAFSDIIQRRDWENPQSVNINNLKAHSPLASFRDEEDARDNVNAPAPIAERTMEIQTV